MRLVAWNCAMAFHRKLPAMKALRPEIAVIGECAAPEVIAGDLNNSVIWDRPGWPINHADAVELLDERAIVSSYHVLRGEEQGRERIPTLYWRDRKLHGPRYHLDFVFVPRNWLPFSSLEVGSFRKWVGTGLSDHVPLTLTVTPTSDTAHDPRSRTSESDDGTRREPHGRTSGRMGDTRRQEVKVTEIKNVIDEPARLGECPLWSITEQVLYWIDIDGRAVHRYDPTTGVDTHRSMAGRPGSLALTSTVGRILVAVEHELVWLDWESGATESFVTLEEPGTGNRLNDGRCDPAGRFVVGSMYEDTGAEKRTGILHSIEPDGSATRIRDGIGVSNGLAFDPGRERAYFADTHTDSIIMWDYDADTGERRNERLFVDYSDLPGRPDGGCVDAEGCYWSASVYGWAMTRFTPDGEVERRIEVPVEKPSMPAFGGADLTTLYVTSIGSGDADATTGRDGFVGGMLLEIDAGAQGVPEPLFAG